MNKCKLSIIIPAYNTDKYLEHTLNILSGQSLKEYEIIIINDNSSDSTEKVVLEYQKKISGIRYFKNSSNQGPGPSRNIGINQISGEYVTFLDSDDWPDIFAYETAVEILDVNPDSDFVIWGIKNEYNNKSSSHIRNDYKSYTSINKELAMSLLCNTYALDIAISSYLGNKIFRSDFVKRNNIFFNDFLFEDVAFSFETIACAKQILLLPNIYTHYYQRSRSIVHSFTKTHITDMFKSLTYISELVNNSFPQYKKDFDSLVEKCSKTLFRLMYDNIEDPIQINDLLCFYFDNLFTFCSIKKILKYLDHQRVKNILLNI